jgi:hypothetical protein
LYKKEGIISKEGIWLESGLFTKEIRVIVKKYLSSLDINWQDIKVIKVSSKREKPNRKILPQREKRELRKEVFKTKPKSKFSFKR